MTTTPQPSADTLVPGTPLDGGFFVGRFRIGEQLFALIVSPKAPGDANAAWGKSGRDVPGARSFFDGRANTLAMAEAGSPAAQAALQLDIGGFTDWYIPSRDELELLYRHLKPTAETNFRLSGDNPSSAPVGYAYDADVPGQTTVEAFKGGAEALEDSWYWSSTQYSAHGAWNQYFDDGNQCNNFKGNEGRVRAVRRFLIP